MGALNSKISPSSEMLTAVEQGIGAYQDPRSPTPNINRSPISQHEASFTRSPVTKVKDLTADLEENGQQTSVKFLPKRFQSIIDPRSPSTFNRTPLVLGNSPAISDCSLTTVVSSLQYEECSVVQDDDIADASFKDCEAEMPDLCNLQIDYDDSAAIIEPTDEKEETIFEDVQVLPSPLESNDPRSPSIAIVRTPVVLVEDNKPRVYQDQVENEERAKENAERQEQRTPKQQGTEDSCAKGEQTPKKDKSTPNALKAGNRTPLGCMTNNIGAVSNIRRMALIGQLKQSATVGGGDEQKLLSRKSAESHAPPKNVNRTRIPKLRSS